MFDVDGQYLQPPDYLYPEYENTTKLVGSLATDVLSFTHHEVLRGDDINDFVAEIETLAQNVAADGPVTPSQAIDRVVEERGDFGLNFDLAFPLSVHFGDLVERGMLERTRTDDGLVAWRPADTVGHTYVNVLVDVRGHASRRPRNSHRSRTSLVSDSMSEHRYRPGRRSDP